LQGKPSTTIEPEILALELPFVLLFSESLAKETGVLRAGVTKYTKAGRETTDDD
jgi:hypothetical protein